MADKAASAVPKPEPILAGAFNFAVTLQPSPGSRGAPSAIGEGGFQECSGLEIEMEVKEHLEGGRNDGVVRLVGRGKYTNLVLKRGMLHPKEGVVDGQIWQWMQGILGGRAPVTRYDGTIRVLDRSGARTVATWRFFRGLPAKVRGPELNARTGEIAIEELHIAHEGLRLEA